MWVFFFFLFRHLGNTWVSLLTVSPLDDYLNPREIALRCSPPRGAAISMVRRMSLIFFALNARKVSCYSSSLGAPPGDVGGCHSSILSLWSPRFWRPHYWSRTLPLHRKVEQQNKVMYIEALGKVHQLTMAVTYHFSSLALNFSSCQMIWSWAEISPKVPSSF